MREWRVGDHFRIPTLKYRTNISSYARITAIYRDSGNIPRMNFIFLNETEERPNFLVSILEEYEYVTEEEVFKLMMES